MTIRVSVDDFNSVPAPIIEERTHSWFPNDLIEVAARPPEPPIIGGILYPGKRTLLSGESESLKTWFALLLCKAEMDAGFPVAWVDLDAMGPGEILSRLRALQISDEPISEKFLFFEPHGRLKGAAVDDFIASLGGTGVRLCVIDAFNPMLSLHGLEQNSASDVERFWQEIANPICALGVAPAMIDHVVKNEENRGKYATGSERKASGAIVHIGFTPIQTFTRVSAGASLLTTHKDRPGFLPRPALGRLVMSTNGNGVEYGLRAAEVADTSGFRPTFLMQRVSERLEAEAAPVSGRWIEENVTGKAGALRAAVQVLALEGYLERQEGGQGGGANYVFTKAYNEEEEVRPMLGDAPGTQGTQFVSEVRPVVVRPLTGDAPVGGVEKDAPGSGTHLGRSSDFSLSDWRKS